MTTIHPSFPLVFILAGIAACGGSTQGAHPHDMSLASHETMAAREENAGAAHQSQYEPEAKEQTQRCRSGIPKVGIESCWTSVTNPTAEHLKHADEHKKAAADHRAAAQALRDAESRACVGISESDRDSSPFDHKEDIESVEPLYTQTAGKLASKKLDGALVTFRAVPGMTAQWLQRVVDCHLARNSALGHDLPEMAQCPLVPKDVTVTVTGTQTGFAAAIRSANSESAQEVWRRAQALVAPRGK